MKKLKKLKLQSYETLSNSEMKNIIGAYDDISEAYTCSKSTCTSASGVCGSIGHMGSCEHIEEYKGDGYTVYVGCECRS